MSDKYHVEVKVGITDDFKEVHISAPDGVIIALENVPLGVVGEGEARFPSGRKTPLTKEDVKTLQSAVGQILKVAEQD